MREGQSPLKKIKIIWMVLFWIFIEDNGFVLGARFIHNKDVLFNNTTTPDKHLFILSHVASFLILNNLCLFSLLCNFAHRWLKFP